MLVYLLFYIFSCLKPISMYLFSLFSLSHDRLKAFYIAYVCLILKKQMAGKWWYWCCLHLCIFLCILYLFLQLSCILLTVFCTLISWDIFWAAWTVFWQLVALTTFDLVYAIQFGLSSLVENLELGSMCNNLNLCKIITLCIHTFFFCKHFHPSLWTGRNLVICREGKLIPTSRL